MVKTVHMRADVPPGRELHIVLPPDVPVGPAEIVVVVSSQALPRESTLGDLVNSEFFGMWSERQDIDNSVEFARRLRSEAWKRPA